MYQGIAPRPIPVYCSACTQAAVPSAPTHCALGWRTWTHPRLQRQGIRASPFYRHFPLPSSGQTPHPPSAARWVHFLNPDHILFAANKSHWIRRDSQCHHNIKPKCTRRCSLQYRNLPQTRNIESCASQTRNFSCCYVADSCPSPVNPAFAPWPETAPPPRPSRRHSHCMPCKTAHPCPIQPTNCCLCSWNAP